MPALARASIVTVCVVAGAVARPAADQTAPAVNRTGEDARPFVKRTIGVEFAAAGLGELWHLNGSREWLAGATAAIWWAIADGRTLVVRFHATEVFQREPRNAFVNALVPSLRWRIVDGTRVDLFGEAGLGVSWSDTRVPPRGTRFNYLGHVGVGMARRLSSQITAIAAAQLLHLSNANLEGTSRNPDIEALGGYVGIAVGF